MTAQVSVPNELLLTIFEFLFCVQPYQNTKPLLSPLSLNLLLVCKRWLALITNTPSLWTQISILSHPGTRNLRLTQTFIERSRGAPLTIYCDLDDDVLGEDGQANLRALEVIRGQMHRVESLTYHGELHRFFPINSTPHLRQLRVVVPLGGYYYHSRGAMAEQLFSRPQKLEMLSLTLIQNRELRDPFANIDPMALEHLELLLPIPKVDSEHFLSSCKNLRYLKLSIVAHVPDPVLPITFPLLVTLDFEGDSAEFLTSIDAPQLTCLSLEGANLSDWMSVDDEIGPTPFCFPKLRTLRLVDSTGVPWSKINSVQLASIEADWNCGLSTLLPSLIDSTAGQQEGSIGLDVQVDAGGERPVVTSNLPRWAPNLHLLRIRLCTDWGHATQGFDNVIAIVRLLLLARTELQVHMSHNKWPSISGVEEGKAAVGHDHSLQALFDEFPERVVLTDEVKFRRASWEALLRPPTIGLAANSTVAS